MSDVDFSLGDMLNHRESRRHFLRQAAAAVTGVCATTGLPERVDAASQPGDVECSGIKIPMKDVTGKVAFITGASSGIGLGIAKAFVNAGMKVAIGYRTQSHVDDVMAEFAGAGDRVRAIQVDVTDRRAMENAAVEVAKALGKVHVLVNNAGVITQTMSLGDSTYDDWDWMLGVNVTGVFNGVRAFLPGMKAHGEGGQIVATASVGGLFVGQTMHSIYATSKFAVVGLMEALRSELANTNIGVSVVCPGSVIGNLWDASRNRPDSLGETADGKLDAKSRDELRALVAKPDPSFMDPIETGRLVLRGIRNNNLYILTHPEFEQGIRDRSEALIASIPRDLIAPEARIERERRILRNAIYIAERDRKGCVSTK